MTHQIVLAEMEDADVLAPLFDAYRVFYGQPSALAESRHFLFERLLNQQSVVFMAVDRGNAQQKPIGFTQLYPSFSSVALQPLWILNDLYVAPDHRRQGVAKALIKAAIKLVRNREDLGLALEAAVSNIPAQKLYESLGFQQERNFQHYFYHC